MTLNNILPFRHVAARDFKFSFSRQMSGGPMDVVLVPPGDDEM